MYKEPFVLKTITTETFHSTCADIDLFEENQFLKFYAVPFHPHLDILLGSEGLSQLNARIDYSRGKIELNGQEYTLTRYIPPSTRNNKSSKPTEIRRKRKRDSANLEDNKIVEDRSRCTSMILPTNIKKGTVLVPRQQVKNAVIPETLTTVKVPIIGKIKDEDKTLIQTKHIDENQVDICNLCVKSKEDKMLESPSTSSPHLTTNEQERLKALCEDYQEIFYKEGDVLTFSNAMKHKIPLNSDIPIFTRPYQFPQIQRDEINK